MSTQPKRTNINANILAIHAGSNIGRDIDKINNRKEDCKYSIINQVYVYDKTNSFRLPAPSADESTFHFISSNKPIEYITYQMGSSNIITLPTDLCSILFKDYKSELCDNYINNHQQEIRNGTLFVYPIYWDFLDLPNVDLGSTAIWCINIDIKYPPR